MISPRLAAEVLGIQPKLLDNLIARTETGVRRGSRGLERRISAGDLERIALALLLRRDMGLSSSRAMQVAGDLQESGGELAIGVLGSLRFDLTRLRSVIQQALADGIDSHVPRPRGRPAGK